MVVRNNVSISSVLLYRPAIGAFTHENFLNIIVIFISKAICNSDKYAFAYMGGFDTSTN